MSETTDRFRARIEAELERMRALEQELPALGFNEQNELHVGSKLTKARKFLAMALSGFDPAVRAAEKHHGGKPNPKQGPAMSKDDPNAPDAATVTRKDG